MDALMLCYREEPLREFTIGARPLEVGRAGFCDIVVHDEEVAERHLLVQRSSGTVVAYDLRGDGGAEAKPLPAGHALALGRHHSLVRIPDASPRSKPPSGHTEPVTRTDSEPSRLSLLIGRGSEARRVTLERRPITIGSADGNDVVLPDRTVSGRHCRLEIGEEGVVVRDLGSRNGTFVDGVRVLTARLAAGSLLRLGRTDITLVPRGSRGDARAQGLIAESPAMLRVLGEVERWAELKWPVLVLGDSGAGKEGLARALHQRGPRAKRPFVALNAGGVPRDLIETELFGHERGAFTGASSMHKGVFEQADGGTLFLDEIGELPLELQARLLRVLETWEVRRVGAESAVTVDVRLVCATHRDLRSLVAEGSFRNDLYYRIAQLVIEVPPLRQRPEDIRALARHFLEQISSDLGSRRLSRAALSRLLGYPWPGNARELRNVLCAAAASTGGSVIEVDDIDRALERVAGPAAAVRTGSPEALQTVLERHRGNLSAAARALGIPRSTLRDRLKGPKNVEPEQLPEHRDVG